MCKSVLGFIDYIVDNLVHHKLSNPAFIPLIAYNEAKESCYHLWFLFYVRLIIQIAINVFLIVSIGFSILEHFLL